MQLKIQKAEKITTQAGNLFIHLTLVNGEKKELFFYMTTAGKRFLSKWELKNKKLLPQNEWYNFALKTWKDKDGQLVCPTELDARELKLVMGLYHNILQNPLFGFPVEKKEKTPKEQKFSLRDILGLKEKLVLA